MEACTARSIDPIFARYPPLFFLSLPPSLTLSLSLPIAFLSSSLSLSLDVEYDIIANSNDVVAGSDARSLTIFSPEGFKRVAAGAARIDRRINRPIDTKRCGYRTMQRHASSRPPMPPSRRQTKRMPDTYNRSRDAPNK